jgi:hypothetical protein
MIFDEAGNPRQGAEAAIHLEESKGNEGKGPPRAMILEDGEVGGYKLFLKALSGLDGSARFECMPPGRSWCFTAQKDGYEWWEEEQSALEEGEVRKVVAVLHKNWGIRGRCEDHLGNPVTSGIMFRLREGGGSANHELSCDRIGMFSHEICNSTDYPLDIVQLVFSHKDFMDVVFEGEDLIPEEDGWVRLHVVFRKGAVLSGRALDERNQPVSGAEIQIVEMHEEGRGVLWGKRMRTDDRGEFRAEGLREGAYELHAHSDDRVLERPVKISVGESEKLSKDIVLVPGRVLRGRLEGPDGRPVADSPIWITPPKSSSRAVSQTARRFSRTGPDGGFEIRSLPLAFRTFNVRFSRLLGFGKDQPTLAMEIRGSSPAEMVILVTTDRVPPKGSSGTIPAITITFPER